MVSDPCPAIARDDRPAAAKARSPPWRASSGRVIAYCGGQPSERARLQNSPRAQHSTASPTLSVDGVAAIPRRSPTIRRQTSGQPSGTACPIASAAARCI